MKLKTVQEMTLKEKLGQLILPGFHSTYYDDQIKTLIEDYHVGNVILFTRNFTNASQVRELTKKIHEEVIKHTGHIPFIAIDQEGGRVVRLTNGGTHFLSNMAMGALSDSSLLYEEGKANSNNIFKGADGKFYCYFNVGEHIIINPKQEHLIEAGYVREELQERQPTVKDYDHALERHIKDTRIARGYTTREPSSSCYLHSPNPRWKQDALDWIDFINAVMTYGLQIQNDYAEGKPVPTLDEFIANLPQITWTYQD